MARIPKPAADHDWQYNLPFVASKGCVSHLKPG